MNSPGSRDIASALSRSRLRVSASSIERSPFLARESRVVRDTNRFADADERFGRALAPEGIFERDRQHHSRPETRREVPDAGAAERAGARGRRVKRPCAVTQKTRLGLGEDRRPHAEELGRAAKRAEYPHPRSRASGRRRIVSRPRHQSRRSDRDPASMMSARWQSSGPTTKGG